MEAPGGAPTLGPKTDGYPYEAIAPEMSPEETTPQERTRCPEYDAIVEAATVPHGRQEDIAPDCWGALFFITVQDIPQWLNGNLKLSGKVRVAFTIFVFALNLFVQGSLLYFICSLLLMPSMFLTQDVYKSFAKNAFFEGEVNVELFNQMPTSHKDDVCGLALSQALFVRVIIFLWITTNVSELKDIWVKGKETLAMPPLPAGLDLHLMVHDVKDTEAVEVLVVCMTRSVKVSLFTLIFIPKVLISVFLMVAGSLWLLAADQIADLILNSLALGFVTQIDEMICKVFFPAFMFRDLEIMALALPGHSKDPAVAEEQQLRSFGYASLVLAATAFVVEIGIRFQPVIPNYSGIDVSAVCSVYLASEVPGCMPGQTDCFPES